MLLHKRNILFYHIILNCKTFLSFLFLQSPPKYLEIWGIYDSPSKKELSAAQASGIFLLLKHQQSKPAGGMRTPNCNEDRGYETSKLHWSFWKRKLLKEQLLQAMDSEPLNSPNQKLVQRLVRNVINKTHKSVPHHRAKRASSSGVFGQSGVPSSHWSSQQRPSKYCGLHFILCVDINCGDTNPSSDRAKQMITPQKRSNDELKSGPCSWTEACEDNLRSN